MPTFNVATPPFKLTLLTVPLTLFPLLSTPWMFHPIRLPAVATFWPMSTEFSVLVHCVVASTERMRRSPRGSASCPSVAWGPGSAVQ